MTVHQQQPVPDTVRDLGALGEPDYVDLFTLTADDVGRWPPERWARVMIEDIAGRGGQFIFRVLLGMRLASRHSFNHIAGWRVAASDDEHVRLEATSWFLRSRMVVRVADGQVSLATFMRYDRHLAAAVWTPLSALHRTLAPGLLRDAHKALRGLLALAAVTSQGLPTRRRVPGVCAG
ncbi:hypothetical protein [Pseudonocardia lacus]|uniref:hypothetical protein n=1 Tax=Pseudonocardia lacus TaxID=2835865 RepID=UPI001BDCD161|nr:hypothetical protein [Pseudonocardia lacus]